MLPKELLRPRVSAAKGKGDKGKGEQKNEGRESKDGEAESLERQLMQHVFTWLWGHDYFALRALDTQDKPYLNKLRPHVSVMNTGSRVFRAALWRESGSPQQAA